jgi:polyisoprenoid-binding protein YceI
MKKTLFVLAALLALSAPAFAQKFFTRDAKVTFNSNTPLEKIEAVNKSGTAVIDTKTGRMEWKVLIKNFLFEKALMQEHFNENYMESSKFPNATFKGDIANVGSVDFGKDGKYPVTAKGKLNIHGVERDVEIPGTITVSGGTVKVNSNFTVAVADYGISIPAVVKDNIAKQINVGVDAALSAMQSTGK